MKISFWTAGAAALVLAACSGSGRIDDDGGFDAGADADADAYEEVTPGDDGGGDDGAGDAADDNIPFNAAAFVSQVAPATVATGTAFAAEITMRNTGSTTWTAADPGPYRLGAANPRDNAIWGAARVELTAGASVAPGEAITFLGTLTAPATAGVYDFQWQMVQEGVEWFGQASDNLQIEVTGGCVPLTCEQAGVICGTLPDGCGGQIVCGSCCGPCAEQIGDPLNGSTLGLQSGGEWIVGGGWQTHGLDDRIVYAFSAIDCGYLEVDVRNFDPTHQYVHNVEPVNCDESDCYSHILALYRGDHGSHHAAADNCESQIEVQVTGPETDPLNRTAKFKLKVATTGWDGGANSYSGEYTWDTGRTYHLRLDWNSEEILFFVDGQQAGGVDLSWPGDSDYSPTDSPECTDDNGRRLALTHFFLGRDVDCQGCLDGPIYSNLVVFDCNPE